VTGGASPSAGWLLLRSSAQAEVDEVDQPLEALPVSVYHWKPPPASMVVRPWKTLRSVEGVGHVGWGYVVAAEHCGEGLE